MLSWDAKHALGTLNRFRPFPSLHHNSIRSLSLFHFPFSPRNIPCLSEQECSCACCLDEHSVYQLPEDGTSILFSRIWLWPCRPRAVNFITVKSCSWSPPRLLGENNEIFRCQIELALHPKAPAPVGEPPSCHKETEASDFLK